jgi:hypothetical protein
MILSLRGYTSVEAHEKDNPLRRVVSGCHEA